MYALFKDGIRISPTYQELAECQRIAIDNVIMVVVADTNETLLKKGYTIEEVKE